MICSRIEALGKIVEFLGHPIDNERLECAFMMSESRYEMIDIWMSSSFQSEYILFIDCNYISTHR